MPAMVFKLTLTKNQVCDYQTIVATERSESV